MINIYTLADMRGDVSPGYNEDTPFVKLEDVIGLIQEVCHSLGEPDFNGENRIVKVDGMHWKELSEKFERGFED